MKKEVFKQIFIINDSNEEHILILVFVDGSMTIEKFDGFPDDDDSKRIGYITSRRLDTTVVTTDSNFFEANQNKKRFLEILGRK